MTTLPDLIDAYLDEKKLVEMLEIYTEYCLIEDNRGKLDPKIFQQVSILLERVLILDFDDKQLSPIRIEAFRFLRNSVANCKRNQELIGQETKIISSSFKYLEEYLKLNEDAESNYLVETRCCLQFISNFIVDHKNNLLLILPYVNVILLELVKRCKDEKIVQYSAMSVHLVLKMKEEWVLEMDLSAIPCMFEKTHLEFVLYVLETLATSVTFMVSILQQLDTEDRTKFLKIVIAHSELHVRLPDQVCLHIAKQFKEKADRIMKSSLEEDELICWEVATMLELICCITATTQCSILVEDTSLLVSTIFLLKSVHAASKDPVNQDSGTDPVPVKNSLSKLKIQDDTEEIRALPTYQFKAYLIRLIANLSHQNFKNQELVRETDGLSIILDSCSIDARNPFITQWAVFAVRNLCEGNQKNQEYITHMQHIDSANTLSNLHLVGI